MTTTIEFATDVSQASEGLKIGGVINGHCLLQGNLCLNVGLLKGLDVAGGGGVKIVDVGLVVLIVMQGHYLVGDVGFERLLAEEPTLAFAPDSPQKRDCHDGGDKQRHDQSTLKDQMEEIAVVLCSVPQETRQKQTHVIRIRQRWERVLMSTRHISRSSNLRRFRA